MRDKKFYICFVLTIWFVFEVGAQTRATYGEPCSRANRCDSRASLTCNNGTCECIMADVMAFDGTKCAVFAGEKCTFTAVDVQGRGEERSWKEELPCVKNSWCQEGFCTCLPEFFESSNGTCIRKRDFQEDCQFDVTCKNEQFLICNEDKKCDCNSTISTYDVARQLCVTMAGQSCDNGEQCVPNSKCVQDRSFRRSCTCDSGYFANPRGECEKKRGYNEPCEDNKYCQYGSGRQDLQLVCSSDGRCNCNATTSLYDSSKNICVRLAGADCADFPNCVAYSVCSGGNRCNCLSEYFRTSSGTCEPKRDYGKPCESIENCKRDLKCGFNGLCECEEVQQVYDSSKVKCVGLVNGACNYEYDCISNARCHYQVCSCNSGYSGSKNGSCLKSHGSSCGTSWTEACNTEQGTACKQGICTCKYENLQSFNSHVQKCVSIVLGPCDESIPCVENAHCSNQDETFRQCVCDEGFVSVNGKCLIAFGQPCLYHYNRGGNVEYNSYVCDHAAPLKCIEGTCQCDYLQDYDYETKKCRGLVGSFCWREGAKDYCTPNAICTTMRGFSFEKGMCRCKEGWLSTRAKRCILEIAVRGEKQAVEDEGETGTTFGFNNTEISN